MTTIQTHIGGLGCRVKLIRISHQKPLGPRCDSDLDCYGYTDIEFDVLRLRGRGTNAWLTDRMTDADRARIENELLEARK
jgi:hypothetical protein